MTARKSLYRTATLGDLIPGTYEVTTQIGAEKPVSRTLVVKAPATGKPPKGAKRKVKR